MMIPNEPDRPAAVVPCPSCARRMRMPVRLYGQAARCPYCSHKFTAHAGTDPTPASTTGAAHTPPADKPLTKKDLTGVIDTGLQVLQFEAFMSLLGALGSKR